jgi:hypothetical protein
MPLFQTFHTVFFALRSFTWFLGLSPPTNWEPGLEAGGTESCRSTPGTAAARWTGTTTMTTLSKFEDNGWYAGPNHAPMICWCVARSRCPGGGHGPALYLEGGTPEPPEGPRPNASGGQVRPGQSAAAVPGGVRVGWALRVGTQSSSPPGHAAQSSGFETRGHGGAAGEEWPGYTPKSRGTCVQQGSRGRAGGVAGDVQGRIGPALA